MRICKTCKIAKPWSAFQAVKKGRDGIAAHCYACRRIKENAFLKTNKGFESYLWREYRILVHEFEGMRLAQDNKCPLCTFDFIDRPDVDHNHKTNRIRGLLCHPCNNAVAFCREEINIVKLAIRFLAKPSLNLQPDLYLLSTGGPPYKENDKRGMQEYRWWRKYRLSRAQYESMLAAQEGNCAICLDWMKKPFIDHDHATMQVRGLLCLYCNNLLGSVRDSILILERVITYLEEDQLFTPTLEMICEQALRT